MTKAFEAANLFQNNGRIVLRGSGVISQPPGKHKKDQHVLYVVLFCLSFTAGEPAFRLTLVIA